MELALRALVALAAAFVIWRVGLGVIRAVSLGAGARTKIEPEDVENLDVYFMCGECGTEFKVTQLGEVQVPRHCGEPMRVVRRPRPSGGD